MDNSNTTTNSTNTTNTTNENYYTIQYTSDNRIYEELQKSNHNTEVLKNGFLLFFGVALTVLIVYMFYKTLDNFISF